MCFSAPADLIAGIGITALGVDTWRHVTRRSDRLVALLPVVLGLHLLTEVPVWWGLGGDLADDLWRPAAHLYLIVAFVVVPVLVPLAIGALDPTRRLLDTGFALLGVLVAAVLLAAIVRGPVEAEIVGRHITYRTGLSYGGAVVAVYVVATCGPVLTSRLRRLRWFGVANLAAVVALILIDKTALISLWCAWAAALSLVIAAHVRTGSPAGKRSPPAPFGAAPTT